MGLLERPRERCESLVPRGETTILMNFLNLTSYDVKIGSIDSYNEHSCENSLSYIKFGPWEYIRPSMSKTKKNAKLPFLRKMHLKKKSLAEVVAKTDTDDMD